MKITKDKLLKLLKKLNREEALRNPYRPSSTHQTSKKDVNSKKKNTVRDWENE